VRAARDRDRLPGRTRRDRRGENGVLVPPGDADAVARALRELADVGPGSRRELGEAGRAKAVREWSWATLVDRMDSAYAEAIATRRARMGR
jgi:glycosyltransferase involved in cell wall biosynthesis